MSDEQEMRKLTENVSSLQTDMAQVGQLVGRLDITIQKLIEVTSSVSQLLAVQGNRLDFQEKASDKIQNLIEKRRDESDIQIKGLNDKLQTFEKDFQADISATENKILDKMTLHNDQMNVRITSLEKWMWLLMGGSVVVGFILNVIPWDKLF
jgi:predicted RNase H-like nuclease (RuvC/YqgF family)